MFGFLERIKKLFTRKKEGAQEEAAEVKEPENQQHKGLQEAEIKEEAKALGEPERKQKTCPNCKAPNDVFVHKCWLCKNDI